MNRISKLFATVALAAPLVAIAQDVKPADQPRTNLEKQQTTETGQAPKYGGPGTDVSGPGKPDASMSKPKHKTKADKTNAAQTTTGDTSTPAPTK